MRKNLAVLLLTVPALAVPAPASAQDKPATLSAWLYDYFVNGASVTAGFGLHQADITVRDKATGAAGKITDRDNTALFLSYSTRPSFIGASKFGYNFMLSYTTFNADKQEVAKDTYRDLGTRLHGRVASVVPTLFYQWGEHGRRAAYLRTGLGLGLGVTKYDGDIILDYPANTAPVSVSSGNYDLKFAGSFYLEGRYRHAGFTLVAAGPSYDDDKYQYNVNDISAYLSYTYYF
jgi:hypothetical protein